MFDFNPFSHRIISNFQCFIDTYNVIIKFFSQCKIHLNFSANQNERYTINLIDIRWLQFNIDK